MRFRMFFPFEMYGEDGALIAPSQFSGLVEFGRQAINVDQKPFQNLLGVPDTGLDLLWEAPTFFQID